MALTATIHHLELALSDVDRNVYETLDLRLARHPSETLRYMLTRTLAYALSYEEGIAFSKGGLSQTDEPPISVVDLTGVMLAWIDVGNPSADRLHKASKLARRVSLYTHVEMSVLRKEAATRNIHRIEDIEVFRFAPAMLDALESKVDRKMKFELVRTDDQLYFTWGGETIEGRVERHRLVDQETAG